MGHPIAWYNMGGGLRDRLPGTRRRPIAEFARAIVPALKATGCRLAMEPGRVIAGNAGILVSRVLYTKQSGDKRFLIQDAAMNDLIRPALYESFHRIWPVDVPDARRLEARPRHRAGTSSARSARAATSWPRTASCPALERGDLLAVFARRRLRHGRWPPTTTRARAPPKSWSTATVTLVRRRETYEDLVAGETAP